MNYFAHNILENINTSMIKTWNWIQTSHLNVLNSYIKMTNWQDLPANSNIGFNGIEFLVVTIFPIMFLFDWVAYMGENKKQVIS